MEGVTCIRDMKPGMKSISLRFIVLEVGRPSNTKEGHLVRSCRIADSTASINLSVWGDYGSCMRPGDIIDIDHGYTTMFKDCLTLYCGKTGTLSKVSEFCMLFAEHPFMSDPNIDSSQVPKQVGVLGSAERPGQSPTHDPMYSPQQHAGSIDGQATPRPPVYGATSKDLRLGRGGMPPSSSSSASHKTQPSLLNHSAATDRPKDPRLLPLPGLPSTRQSSNSAPPSARDPRTRKPLA